MAAAVLALPAAGGFVEVMLKASVGAGVYAAAVLVLNAAGVRDLARRLLERRTGSRMTA
jgi:hypothetical protein